MRPHRYGENARLHRLRCPRFNVHCSLVTVSCPLFSVSSANSADSANSAAFRKTVCLTRYVPRLPSEALCCPRSLNRSLLPPKQAPTLRTARPLRLLPLPHEFGSSYHLPVKHWDNGPGILPPIFELLQAMHCRRRWRWKLCCKIAKLCSKIGRENQSHQHRHSS